MPHGHEFPQKIFKLITNAVSALLLIIIFYILQYLFDMDFVCSCTHVAYMDIHTTGVLYLLIPPLILTWVVTTIDSFHHRRIFSSWDRLGPKCCWRYLLKLFFSYVCLSAVWVATVMLDGDWYFCLMTNRNASQTGIPCKQELTYNDNLIKAAYKSKSLEYGFWIIGALIVVWIIVLYGWTKTQCWSKLRLCSRPHYRVVYEELLVEQVSSHLQDQLTKIATERAKVICEPYLCVISDRSVDDMVSEAWWKISASDFYLTDPERPSNTNI